MSPIILQACWCPFRRNFVLCCKKIVKSLYRVNILPFKLFWRSRYIRKPQRDQVRSIRWMLKGFSFQLFKSLQGLFFKVLLRCQGRKGTFFRFAKINRFSFSSNDERPGSSVYSPTLECRAFSSMPEGRPGRAWSFRLKWLVFSRRSERFLVPFCPLSVSLYDCCYSGTLSYREQCSFSCHFCLKI